MDIRLKQLSYSSRLTLHSCPRKYQLYKLSSKENTDDEEDSSSESVTFAFGHAVGTGIQELLVHGNIEKAIYQAFLAWKADFLADNSKQNKSFWIAAAAIKKFESLLQNGFLSGWDLYTYNGKPATELSFIITFPDGFTYKGFVDAVLVNQESGAVMVLECKTTGMSYVSAATYKNSAQALGYSIVLDSLFPNLSHYKVKYLIYKTKALDFEVMDFEKDYLSRALWIREILLDIEMLKLYDNASIYPMHGESCFSFYRECEYLGLCTLSTEKLTNPLTESIVEQIQKSTESDFEIKLGLNDLILSQLDKEILAIQ